MKHWNNSLLFQKGKKLHKNICFIELWKNIIYIVSSVLRHIKTIKSSFLEHEWKFMLPYFKFNVVFKCTNCISDWGTYTYDSLWIADFKYIFCLITFHFHFKFMVDVWKRERSLHCLLWDYTFHERIRYTSERGNVRSYNSIENVVFCIVSSAVYSYLKIQ